MTSPKTKGEVLSKTTKTYIQELAIEHKYGIRKEFWSRYTDKGNEVEDEGYYQLQGYMWLTGKDEALLCYCLVNTPFQIVEDEVRREHWKQGLIDESLDVRDFVQKKHNFDHIPKEKRVKVFKIAKDEEIIEKIKQRVEECREYYNNLIENL